MLLSIPVEDSHQWVESGVMRAGLCLYNLLWQVDAGLISGLGNTLHLVLTNWPLMENVFVEPDSCRWHLKSCLAVINITAPHAALCSSKDHSLVYYLLGSLRLFIEAPESAASKRRAELLYSPNKRLSQRKESLLLLLHVCERKQKQRLEEKTRQDLAAVCVPSCSVLSFLVIQPLLVCRASI